MLYISRNNQEYGPYDESTILSYVNNGQILLHDIAKDYNTKEVNTVSYFLKKAGFKTKVQHAGGLIKQLRQIGSELIIPKNSFINKKWLSDKRLIILSIVGLFPTVLISIPIGSWGIFYSISLYFSCIWGLFFFYFFKTNQVSVLKTVSIFFITQLIVFIVWDILGLCFLNPFYLLINSSFPHNMLGFILGVGLTEELAKALPLLILCKRAKEPLLPQTLVYYGLMSGIAFGVFEGVQYQMSINTQLSYTGAFFMNIARLTSLPFLHAVWCGIAGYFIAFANLYPKYRIALYFLAILVPSIIHGLYDTFCSNLIILSTAITFGGVILLVSYLKQSVNYQSKLRN